MLTKGASVPVYQTFTGRDTSSSLHRQGLRAHGGHRGALPRFAEPTQSRVSAVLLRGKFCFCKLAGVFSCSLPPVAMKARCVAGCRECLLLSKILGTFLLSERSPRLLAKQYMPQQQRHLKGALPAFLDRDPIPLV